MPASNVAIDAELAGELSGVERSPGASPRPDGTSAARRERARAARRAILGSGGWLRRAVGWAMVLVAAGLAVYARRLAPWIPAGYLLGLLGAGIAVWRLAWWRGGPGRFRWPGLATATAVLIGLLPVPWLQANLVDPPGSAWRLDGRLSVLGQTADPPGRWYWLTAGRPPLVVEAVYQWAFDRGAAPTSLVGGRRAHRPAFNEPAAAAVGLRRAGWPIPMGILVEVHEPFQEGLPERVVLTGLNGVELTDRDAWQRATVPAADWGWFTTDEGHVFRYEGPGLPYRRIDVLDVPESGLEVTVGGLLADLLPGRWYRGLSVGRSHGLMVALVTYAHASGEDLARGRSIAGTGGIQGDGSVTRIGGLRSKAQAARRAGVDVLLVPAGQVSDLADFDAGSMAVVPVATLDEAIAALAGRLPVSPPERDSP